MGYVGYAPAAKPLTSADITDGIISSADIANGAITSAKLAAGVGGKVLQVVTVTKTDSFTTTATSDTAATGLSLSITPSSASNKIYVIFAGTTYCLNSANYFGAISIYKNSTRIIGGTAGVPSTSGGTVNSCIAILDSPATTSAITYQIYLKSEGNSSTVGVNNPSGIVTDPKATLTAFEIAG